MHTVRNRVWGYLGDSDRFIALLLGSSTDGNSVSFTRDRCLLLRNRARWQLEKARTHAYLLAGHWPYEKDPVLPVSKGRIVEGGNVTRTVSTQCESS